MSICIFATWIALSFRYGEFVYPHYYIGFPVLISVCIAIPIFYYMGIYKVIFRYVHADQINIFAKAIILYTLIYSLLIIIFEFKNIPRSIGLMQPMIVFILICTSRWAVITWLDFYFPINPNKKNRKEVIIYGAGSSGRQLAGNLLYSSEYKFLFFVDDNKTFWGGTIDRYPVRPLSSINKYINTKHSIEVWLTMTNISMPKRLGLIKQLSDLGLHVRTLPSFSDLTSNRVYLSDVRELNINELIGREPVNPNIKLLKKSIFKKTVMVTGAGGSIGSEICRQVIMNEPNYILLVENSEFALYHILNELRSILKEKLNKKIILVPLLIDIQDSKSMSYVFKIWKPYTVYHAAAYKHVSIVESNILSGIKNNLIGTLQVANLAIFFKVKKFVLISTDKAVRPTNIMGVTKRLAEIILQLLSSDPNNKNTCFCIVRFGNVLGSSGSVVPLFRKQIKAGGPVTLTDKKVTRYFMTTTEAAQLVIQAGSMAKGGEVFVLDMGKPIRIEDIANKMIETSGLKIKNENNPFGDIEVQIIGLKPGEKLHEELLIGNNPKKTKHSRILQANEECMLKEDFELLMKNIYTCIDNNNIPGIIDVLKHNIVNYSPSNEILDIISKFKKEVIPK